MITTQRIEEAIEPRISNTKPFSLARIMVATDFSPASQRALDYAIALARRFGSQIYLTHVITFAGHQTMEPDLGVPTGERLRTITDSCIQSIVDSGCLYGVRYEVVVEEGTLWPALDMLLTKNNIDLLVLGTQGMSGAMKVVFGSSAEQIFRQANIPVLTVGPRTKKEAPFEAEFKNILFATAFGPGAAREAALAYALAEEHRSKLMFLHVTDRPDSFSETVCDYDASREKEAIKHKLQELMPTGCQPLCKVEFHVGYGQPTAEILRFAREKNADLIVIGAKKRGPLAGHVVHSKAFGVVRGAGCPVLTIKS